MQKAGDRSDQFADGDRRTSAHVEGSVGPGVNERGKRFAKIRRMNKIPHLVLRHTERVALTVKGCDQTRYKFFFGLARPIREEDAAPGEAAGMGGTDLPADLVKPMFGPAVFRVRRGRRLHFATRGRRNPILGAASGNGDMPPAGATECANQVFAGV